MNNLVPVDLDVLAFKINQAVDKGKVSYNNAIASLKNGLESDREIGELLIQAKAALPHGQFIQWVITNCQFGRAQANRRMIALIIEFLPEVELKAILSQSISLGKEYLPDDVATNSSKLLIGTSGNESFTLF